MNKYPSWLNILVLVIFFAGALLALPNIFGSVPAVQLADTEGAAYPPAKVDEIVGVLSDDNISPEAGYIEDGRVVLRFDSVEDQEAAGKILRDRYRSLASVATTLTPKLPAWVRDTGLRPMSLGLDLRGGVYFLLEVDMETAISSRLKAYQESFQSLLSDSDVRPFRVEDPVDGVLLIRECATPKTC